MATTDVACRLRSGVLLVALLAGGCSFEGISSTEGAGLDVHIAVGNNHIVEATNGLVRIFRKQPIGQVVSTITTNTFVGCSGFVSDPRVRYDPAVQRWYASALETPLGPGQQGALCLAVSTGPNPEVLSGAWVYHRIPAGGINFFPDFPQIGFSDDKVVVTANTSSGWTVWTFDKADLIAGVAPAMDVQSLGFVSITTPATSLSPTDILFMVRMDPTNLTVYCVMGTPDTGVTIIPDVLTVASPTPPSPTQKGTSDVITGWQGTRDVVYRNGSLWAGTTAACVPPGDTQSRACLHLVELRKTASFFVAQNIFYGQAATHFFMPALTIDSADALVTVFAASSPTLYLSMYAAGRRPGDPPNMLRAPASALKAGLSTYDDGLAGVTRWGDYFGAASDPVNGQNVWLVGQYATSPTSYGTFVQLSPDANIQ